MEVFWKIKANAYADLMARFIEITLPDLQRLFGKQRRHTSSTNHVTLQSISDSRAHQLLDRKISEIRDFLAGRAVRTPGAEELCDWIQICYLFELSNEGQQLFRFVQPQSLSNEWLYKRTKKYAELCRIKSQLNG